jgi:hypothetical protein
LTFSIIAPPRPLGALLILTQTVTFGEQGYQRDVISHKPALYDDEGYEVDSEEDDERVEAATANASELYPYADIRIEGRTLLENCPLTFLTRSIQSSLDHCLLLPIFQTIQLYPDHILPIP